jgi:ribosomal-protein-alanine N-acetyltransferase
MDRLWVAPGGLHIEPANGEDAEALTILHQAGFYRGWPREEFAAFLADPKRTPGYVACDARRRVAGFALWRIAAEEAELLTIAVERRWRGKGVGRALMRASLDDLMRSPVQKVFLEVEDANSSAIRLYRGEGFSQIGERRGYYERPDGGAATALVMSRDVG